MVIQSASHTIGRKFLGQQGREYPQKAQPLKYFQIAINMKESKTKSNLKMLMFT